MGLGLIADGIEWLQGLQILFRRLDMIHWPDLHNYLENPTKIGAVK